MMKILHTPEDIGNLIRETRKAQGLTQPDLAGISNTGLRFIVDLEKGKTTAQIGKTMHVMNMLGIPLMTKEPDKE
jgi:HTH-type transcriptional regulator / antitoxin HipB